MLLQDALLFGKEINKSYLEVERFISVSSSVILLAALEPQPSLIPSAVASQVQSPQGSGPYQHLGIQHGTCRILCSKVLIHYNLDATIISTPAAPLLCCKTLL